MSTRSRRWPFVPITVCLVLIAAAAMPRAQSSRDTRLSSVTVRQTAPDPTVLVLTANGPLAWRELDAAAGDPPERLRLRVYGVERGDVPPAMDTPLGRLEIEADGDNLSVTLTPSPGSAPASSWRVRLGRGANIIEISRNPIMPAARLM